MRLAGTCVGGDIVAPPLRQRAVPLLFGLWHSPSEVQRDDHPPSRSDKWATKRRMRIVNIGTGTDVSKLRWSPTVTKFRSFEFLARVRKGSVRQCVAAGERPIGRKPAWTSRLLRPCPFADFRDKSAGKSQTRRRRIDYRAKPDELTPFSLRAKDAIPKE
jgi:hypothetical protein